MRHIPRQQEPVTESAMLARGALSLRSVASARASLLCAPQTPGCADHHPARSGLRAKIAREDGGIEPPCRAHPPCAALRTDEPAPLWSDGREPCCARQAAGHASTAAKPRQSLRFVPCGESARPLPSVGLRLRSRRKAASPHARRQSAGCSGRVRMARRSRCPRARPQSGRRCARPPAASMTTPARTAVDCSARDGSANARRPRRLGKARFL